MTKDNKKEKGLTLGKILRFFKNDDDTSGQLTVSGYDSVYLEVRCREAKNVRVYFGDPDPNAIPCNPGSDDCLEYELIHKKGKTYLLKIIWKVSGIRIIHWTTAHKHHGH